ncbi:MAG: 50S ribosomal protein L25/general stress protein Ctc [Gammaproteobacteria bacterium]|nr:50S ribosomal protein L25/general stress protein Ctc [Gammaproteobacteria bacterium]
MNIDFVLDSEVRAENGTNANRRLRRTGKIPAVLYGAGKEALPLSLGHNEVLRHLENEAFYSHILTVKIDGKEEKVVLKDLQRHPFKPTILHLDLLRVDANTKIHMHVPLHFEGEDAAPGIKHGGSVSHLMVEVEVSCLPSDLPEFISVDLSSLDVGESIHLSELVLPEGVSIVALSRGAEHDLPVVLIHKPRVASDDDSEGEESAATTEEG